MERLTVEKCGELLIKYNDGEYRSPCLGCDSINKCNLGPIHLSCGIYNVLKKLKEYEDLEEQGKLLKLPCKLGDTTFWISDEDEDGNKIPTVREDDPIVGIAMQEDGLYTLSAGDNEYQKVGTRWAFITREEAEAALKEMDE